MMEYLDLIIEIVAFVIAIILLQGDIRGKGINKKFYYIWGALLIVGMVFFGAFGIMFVAVVYYIWSRHFKNV